MAVGTKDDPWVLKTPPGTSEYTMYRDEGADPPALVCQVGSTTLKYHLGAVDAAITAAEATLAVAADHVDRDPYNRSGLAELTARRARAVVEKAVDEALGRTDRALGPGPLCLDEQHARAVADLTVYVRQSHAERDLAALGLLAALGRIDE